jgi:DNA-binding transcriptional LysR family regulator
LYRPKTTIQQWRTLQAVVDYSGYAQAAQKLNKSQSSLNHAVAKLQGMLDVQLLKVIGRKAVLTAAGHVMLRRSRYLTQNVEDLELLAININQDWEPEIQVVIDLAYPGQRLYRVLKEFLTQSRGSQFKQLTAFLVCPLPDNKGPGTQLLETLILHHRQIDLPSSLSK